MESVLYCSRVLLPDGQALWRERQLALAASGDYRCQGLVVWYARIWVILVLRQFQPHLLKFINVVAPIVQNTDLVGCLVCRQGQWT